MEYNENTRLIDLTVGELRDIFSLLMPTPVKKEPVEIVHGTRGLCDLLGVSSATAQRLVSSGKLKKATYKIGRKNCYNKALVLDILNKN